MKTCIYILLCCSFIFSESKLVQFEYFDNSMLSYNNNLGVDVIKSAILPGWGQYSSRNYKKAAIFLCVESIAFGIYFIKKFDWLFISIFYSLIDFFYICC